MSNVTVQEALTAAIELIQCFEAKLTNSQTAHSLPSEKVKRKLRDAISEIDKCEPVAYIHTATNTDKDGVEWVQLKAIDTSPQPRELYAGDCVAYLYKDNNGGLKICNESPPPDKSFPVFITNLSFLDVARTVLDDCSDLIIKHGGVNLWKELIAKINRDYKQLNTKG